MNSNIRPTHDPQLRVLFITRKWPPAVGGMETYSVELVKELQTLVELDVLPLAGNANGYPPGPTQLAAFGLRAASQLWRKGRYYDVVHLGDLVLFPLAWLHARIAPGKVRIVTAHGLDLIYGNRRGLAPRVYRWLQRWCVTRQAAVHLVLSNSSNTADIATTAGFSSVAAVPLGVRLPVDPPAPCKPASPPYLLFIGRLVKRKGAAWFAEAVLPKLPPDLSLHVVGKSWDETEERTLSSNPRVRLRGYLSDEELRRERRGSIAVVMPNISVTGATDVEGFGIAALEPIADGVPVLAAAVEGLRDAVRDGETGFLLPERDDDAWVSKILSIMNWTMEERAAYALCAWRSASDDYSWSRVARDTVAQYQKVLLDSRPAGADVDQPTP